MRALLPPNVCAIETASTEPHPAGALWSGAGLHLLENTTLLSSQMGFLGKKPQILNHLHNLWCVSVQCSLYLHNLFPKSSLQQDWNSPMGDSGLSDATSAASPCSQMDFHPQGKLLIMFLLIRKSGDFPQTFQFCHSRNGSEGSALGIEALWGFFWGTGGLCYWKDKELQVDHKSTTKKKKTATQRDKIEHPKALLYLFHMSLRNLKDILSFNVKIKTPVPVTPENKVTQ